MNTARSLQFPLPLSSIVEQLWIWGSAQGYGREDDAGLVRCFLPGRPEAVKESAGKDQKSAPRQNGTSQEVSKVAFIGLGAMGQGAAASLLRGGYVVSGYDVSAAAVEKFASQDKKAIASHNPAEAIKGAEVVFIMVQNAAQIDDVLFGSGKAIEELSDGAVIVINSTVPPSFIRDFEKRLEALNKQISIVDAPVSGGAGRAANGTLAVSTSIIFTSGKSILTFTLDHSIRARSCYFKNRGPADEYGGLNRKSPPRPGWRRRCIISQAHQPATCWRSHRRCS